MTDLILLLFVIAVMFLLFTWPVLVFGKLGLLWTGGVLAGVLLRDLAL